MALEYLLIRRESISVNGLIMRNMDMAWKNMKMSRNIVEILKMDRNQGMES
jgi:hypothetical protein